LRLLQKIERLQKQSNAKAVSKECRHVFTLKMFGEVTRDPPPCQCGGQRITIAVVYAKPQTVHLARE
jgi:hypothetical protein